MIKKNVLTRLNTDHIALSGRPIFGVFLNVFDQSTSHKSLIRSNSFSKADTYVIYFSSDVAQRTTDNGGRNFHALDWLGCRFSFTVRLNET